MENTKIRAGIIQFDVKLGDTNYNLKKALEMISALKEKGVEIAVMPEMWSSGFDNKNISEQAKYSPYILEKISNAANANNMIIAGSMPEYADSKIYNTLYVVEKNGKIAGYYRKIHLFSNTNEDKFYGSGDKTVVLETSLGSIGLMTCYDIRFPELARTLVLKGAKIILLSAQWPKFRVHHWDVLLQARAIENQLFVIASNRCGIENELEFAGHSQIISPFGNILAKAEYEECYLDGVLEFQELYEYRTKLPCLKERVPDVYFK
ncbi:MAG: carbon-nitrogen family hydrolase [Desulfobacterales bacterium]|nr:carbon-nitrogen family hydrolase [Desulfobacterales bacterium]